MYEADDEDTGVADDGTVEEGQEKGKDNMTDNDSTPSTPLDIRTNDEGDKNALVICGRKEIIEKEKRKVEKEKKKLVGRKDTKRQQTWNQVLYL